MNFDVWCGESITSLSTSFRTGRRHSAGDSLSQHPAASAPDRSEGTDQRHRVGHGRNASAPRHPARG